MTETRSDVLSVGCVEAVTVFEPAEKNFERLALGLVDPEANI